MEAGKKIVIRAYSQTQLPQKIQPVQMRAGGGKHYTGQGATGYFESLTRDEVEKLPFVVTPDTVLALHDGLSFDLSNPTDVINWGWVQKHPYLALTRGARADRSVRFYVEDREKEAVEKLTRTKPVTKAHYLIQFESSADKIVRAAKALGHPSPESFSIAVISDWLMLRAEENAGAQAQLVISALSSDNNASINARILMSELRSSSIVAKYKGGVFRFGGEQGVIVGRNDQQFVDFLLSDDNKETVVAMQTALKESKTPALT
jgi:hypothetical protein